MHSGMYFIVWIQGNGHPIYDPEGWMLRQNFAAAISYTGKDIAATKIAISYQRAQVGTLWSAGACAAPCVTVTRPHHTRPDCRAPPTTHGSQTGRVDITAAISL